MQLDNEHSNLSYNPPDGEGAARADGVAIDRGRRGGAGAFWGVDYASWLSDDILLLLCWFYAEENRPPKVQFTLHDQLDNHSAPLESRCLSYPRPGFADAEHRAGKVITARFLRPADARRPLGSVVIEQDGTTFALGPLKVGHAMTDLRTLVREGFAWLEHDERAEVLRFLVATSTAHRETKYGFRLGKNLFNVREALRKPLPEGVIAPDEPQSLAVDTLLAIDEEAFYVRGWMRDAEGEVTQLTAVSPEGVRVELLNGIFRYPRPDVEQFYGVASSELFACRRAGSSAISSSKCRAACLTGWRFEMRTTSGEGGGVESAEQLSKKPRAVRNAILADIFHERPPARRPQVQSRLSSHKPATGPGSSERSRLRTSYSTEHPANPPTSR